jgi:hypothetical protein
MSFGKGEYTDIINQIRKSLIEIAWVSNPK